MQISIHGKKVHVVLLLGQDANLEDQEFVQLNSADLTPAPVEEAAYEEEEEAHAGKSTRPASFGFQPVKRARSGSNDGTTRPNTAV